MGQGGPRPPTAPWPPLQHQAFPWQRGRKLVFLAGLISVELHGREGNHCKSPPRERPSNTAAEPRSLLSHTAFAGQAAAHRSCLWRAGILPHLRSPWFSQSR